MQKFNKDVVFRKERLEKLLSLLEKENRLVTKDLSKILILLQ